MILWQRQASAGWLATNEALLHEFFPGNVAIISRPGRVRSLVQVICKDPYRAEQLQRKFGGRATRLPGDWLAIYQSPSSLAPLRIGERLEIVREQTRTFITTGKSHLIIPAAGAFGTGEHATTAMSLRLLEEISRTLQPGWQLFDAGTGTGILALAARRFGASEVLGLDNDPRAVAHARQNARLNHISQARFVTANLLQWKPSARYEVVTANLFSELLIAVLPIFRRAFRAKGRLIVSGILREQAEAVARALRRNAFQLEKQRRRGKWIALLAVAKT